MRLVSLVIAWLTAATVVSPVRRMLAPRLTVNNYRGEPVIVAVGLVLLPAVAVATAVAVALGAYSYRAGIQLLLWLTAVALAGLLDDVAGDSRHRGFRSHIGALLAGQLTTGMAKVFISAAAALATFALPADRLMPLRLVVLLLAVNFFNQLDLRPGRTAKAFVIFVLPFIFSRVSLLAACGLGAVLGYLPGDLRRLHMLGDCGANLLGGMAGVLLLAVLEPPSLILTAAVLLAGNLAGEFVSLNRLVGANRFLAYLDDFGRRREDNPPRPRNK